MKRFFKERTWQSSDVNIWNHLLMRRHGVCFHQTVLLIQSSAWCGSSWQLHLVDNCMIFSSSLNRSSFSEQDVCHLNASHSWMNASWTHYQIVWHVTQHVPDWLSATTTLSSVSVKCCLNWIIQHISWLSEHFKEFLTCSFFNLTFFIVHCPDRNNSETVSGFYFMVVLT